VAEDSLVFMSESIFFGTEGNCKAEESVPNSQLSVVWKLVLTENWELRTGNSTCHDRVINQ
jgi:hypothetical protein